MRPWNQILNHFQDYEINMGFEGTLFINPALKNLPYNQLSEPENKIMIDRAPQLLTSCSLPGFRV